MKGFLNILKPINMTSSDVVVKVRGILRRASGQKQKVGHFGTLDPLGSGVLPIAVGNATRLFDYCLDKVKVYQTTFVFGEQTDTLDRAGKITLTSDTHPTKQQILSVLDSFMGEFDQIPPQYSAKSVNGKRAYDLAREGIEVELKPKKISIYSIKLIDDKDGVVTLQDGDHQLKENEFAFEIACSGGTYIRSIARDLADSLSTVGYMSSIHRIRSGDFTIENAITLQEFEKEPLRYLLCIDCALKDYDIFNLPQNDADKVLNGVRLHYDNLPKGNFVVKLKGESVAIGESVGGELRLKTRL